MGSERNTHIVCLPRPNGNSKGLGQEQTVVVLTHALQNWGEIHKCGVFHMSKEWRGTVPLHLLPFPVNTDLREPWCEWELEGGELWSSISALQDFLTVCK